MAKERPFVVSLLRSLGAVEPTVAAVRKKIKGRIICLIFPLDILLYLCWWQRRQQQVAPMAKRVQ